MTEATVATEIHQSLDVHRDFTPQIAFNHIVPVDRFAHLQDLCVAQFVDPALYGNADFFTDLVRKGWADAVDVLKRYRYALLRGDVHASDTSQMWSPGR